MAGSRSRKWIHSVSRRGHQNLKTFKIHTMLSTTSGTKVDMNQRLLTFARS